jgi:hypothetical protein
LGAERQRESRYRYPGKWLLEIDHSLSPSLGLWDDLIVSGGRLLFLPNPRTFNGPNQLEPLFTMVFLQQQELVLACQREDEGSAGIVLHRGVPSRCSLLLDGSELSQYLNGRVEVPRTWSGCTMNSNLKLFGNFCVVLAASYVAAIAFLFAYLFAEVVW